MAAVYHFDMGSSHNGGLLELIGKAGKRTNTDKAGISF